MTGRELNKVHVPLKIAVGGGSREAGAGTVAAGCGPG